MTTSEKPTVQQILTELVGYAAGWPISDHLEAAIANAEKQIKAQERVNDSLRIQNLAARLAEWSDKTFPNACWWGKLLHLYEDEIHEIIETPNDPIEWADCLGLIIDGARLAGISIDALLNALDEKIEILGTRTYPLIGPEGWVKHNKAALKELEATDA